MPKPPCPTRPTISNCSDSLVPFGSALDEVAARAPPVEAGWAPIKRWTGLRVVFVTMPPLDKTGLTRCAILVIG